MNSRLLALTLAAVMPWSTAAAPQDTSTVVVTCHNAAWPTLRQVGRYINANSFVEMDAAYRQMLRDGRRACRHGASQVQLIFEAARPNGAPQANTAKDDDGS